MKLEFLGWPLGKQVNGTMGGWQSNGGKADCGSRSKFHRPDVLHKPSVCDSIHACTNEGSGGSEASCKANSVRLSAVHDQIPDAIETAELNRYVALDIRQSCC